MGNDSVMACVLNTTSNTVADIKMYWNTPDKNSLPLQVGIFSRCYRLRSKKFQILEIFCFRLVLFLHISSYLYTLQNTSFGVNLISTKAKDDKIYCKFSRHAHLDIEVPNSPNNSVEFDLNTMPFYLMIAEGPISDDNGLIKYHTNKSISSGNIDFSLYNSHLIEVYSGCGDQKGCWGDVEGCVKAKNCSLLTTYQG